MFYKTASPEKRRELAKTLLSNLTVSGKDIEVTLALPFRLIVERGKFTDGGPYRGSCRTWQDIINQLMKQSGISR